MNATAPAKIASSLPRATIFLSPDVVAAESVSALLPLHGRLLFDGEVTTGFVLSVQISGKAKTFAFTAQSCEINDAGCSYFDYQLVLNTFAFDDGAHALLIQLLESPCEPLNHALEIRNDSALGQATAASLKTHKATQWVWQQGEVDSENFPLHDENLVAWFDQEDASKNIAAVAAVSGLNEAETDALRSFVDEGYCTLPEKVSEELLAQVNSDLNAMLERGEIDLSEEGDHRIEQVHQKSAAAREIWTLPSVIKVLRAIFQEEVLPCQTLVFLRGSGQDVHQDTIHLTPFPAGYMCGVWIALEDIQEDAGPLFVYPGSHRLPRLYTNTVGMRKVVEGDWREFAETFLPRLHNELEDAGFQKRIYLPQKGEILVWHENLAHGGSERKKPGLSRRSIVSHYFSQGAAVWYDSTGRSSGILQPAGQQRISKTSTILRLTRSVLKGDISLVALKTMALDTNLRARMRKFLRR